MLIGDQWLVGEVEQYYFDDEADQAMHATKVRIG